MEHLAWIGINSEKNIINLHSVDAMSILQFIRGRDFQITEIWSGEGKNEKNLLKENEERVWIRNKHYLEISALIEEDESESIYGLNINLDNGDVLHFSHGQLNVKMSDSKLLKKCTIKLLEQYGYFAAERIWDCVSKQDCSMPIYYLLGMEEKDLGNSLEDMKDYGKEIKSNAF
jgi:hypothetical protein